MNNNRSGFKLMKKMISFVAPLIPFMCLAILTGILSFIMAFGLGILGGYGLIALMPNLKLDLSTVPFGTMGVKKAVTFLIICAILKGLLHYIEQLCNHYIAFNILGEYRNKVFENMRRLAPAKLEDKNTGNLMSLVTSDIELLEVFYAHTVSPISIAIGITIALAIFYFMIHPLVAAVALLSYGIIGIVLPFISAGIGNKTAMRLRNEIGGLNGKILDSLRGIREVIQYGQEEKTLESIDDITSDLIEKQTLLKNQLSSLTAFSDSIMILITAAMLAVTIYLKKSGEITGAQAFIATLTMVSTFGPYINLANLGSILTQTFASAERVFAILEEKPELSEITGGKDVQFDNMKVEGVSFKYNNTKVFEKVSFAIKKGEILGIEGSSGCGKSTLLKLIMRFFEPEAGEILINGYSLNEINTKSLRNQIGYVNQTTVLFIGTLRENLIIANPNASDEQLMEACEKASIAEYIRSLPKGLDTQVSELGDNFSGGERQRIGIARCFLSEAKLILLDEPTSNLDSQNEAIILKSMKEAKDDRTIILVSHRKSTLGICDRIISFENGTVVQG